MSEPKKYLQIQSKSIIAKVYHRLKYEAENGVERVSDARWRTAQAVGVSESTISRILREEKDAKEAGTSTNVIFKAPSKRTRERPKSMFDDNGIAIVRKTVMTFRTKYKKQPTLKNLKEILAEKMGYDGCPETLRPVLRESGYEYASLEDNRRVLVEKHDIQIMRYNYLKQLKQYRSEDRYIVYIYATKILDNCSKKPKTEKLSNKKAVMASPIIIVHAGGIAGLIPDAFLIYQEQAKWGNQRDKMHQENYKTWLNTQLLPNLPQNSVIVMDNTSYNTVFLEKLPELSSNMDVIKKWLSEKNIAFQDTMKKVELYDLVLKNKDLFQTYVIDDVIRANGFEFLQLPPYHFELNPMDSIWGDIKNYLVTQNVGPDLYSIMGKINEKIDLIDRDTWESSFERVEDIEEKYSLRFDMDDEIMIYGDDD